MNEDDTLLADLENTYVAMVRMGHNVMIDSHSGDLAIDFRCRKCGFVLKFRHPSLPDGPAPVGKVHFFRCEKA